MTETMNWPLNQKAFQDALNVATPKAKKTYTFWSNKERAYLKKFASTKTVKQLAKELGKTEASVSSQLYILRKKAGSSKKAAPVTPWTSKEDKFLVENHGKMKYAEIGEKLGRTAVAVQIRYSNLKRKGALKSRRSNVLELNLNKDQEEALEKNLKINKDHYDAVKDSKKIKENLMIGLTILNTIILSWILFSSFIQ